METKIWMFGNCGVYCYACAVCLIVVIDVRIDCFTCACMVLLSVCLFFFLVFDTDNISETGYFGLCLLFIHFIVVTLICGMYSKYVFLIPYSSYFENNTHDYAYS